MSVLICPRDGKKGKRAPAKLVAYANFAREDVAIMH